MLFAALAGLLLAGCAPERNTDDGPYEFSTRSRAVLSEPIPSARPAPVPPPPPAPENPPPAPPRQNPWLTRNARVEEYIGVYRASGLPLVLWGRAQAYLPYIREVFDAHGLPRELCLLPLVESGFRPDARTARALGMWQLVEVTARDMGLAVGRARDDRADWKRSTVAAARYLQLLGRKFDGDWALVIAAYNAGPGEIQRATEAQATRDFWRLSLRAEPMNYVPRFLAMLWVLREELPRGQS